MEFTRYYFFVFIIFNNTILSFTCSTYPLKRHNKMTQNLNYVRSVKVSRPTQEEIETAKIKANKNTRTSLAHMCHVEIYTR